MAQRKRLGEENHFGGAVEPAKVLVDLFKRLPISSLDHFPDNELKIVKQQSDAVRNLFSQIMDFSLSQGDVENRQKQLIDNLSAQAQPTFSKLLPLIAYSVSRTADFPALEVEARSAIQSVNDKADSLVGELEEQREQAESILAEVRNTAAEQGVSQEAFHFSQEADRHDEKSWNWLVASIVSSAVLLIYTVCTLFFSKFSLLSANSTIEVIQITASKVLVFIVLGFAMLQAVKNYSAHRHNAVANRHRQNALMTYKAISDAGGTPEVRNAVIQHAASAVYAPSDTGYLKSEDKTGSNVPLVGIAPQSLVDGASASSG